MGAGIVDDVFGANVPDTNVPAQKVIVNVAKSDLQPLGKAPTLDVLPQVAFFIPKGIAPSAGETITWDAHHAWWTPANPLSPTLWVKKLSWEMAP